MPMKKITFNALLNHKAHNYKPMQVEVKKVIPLYGKRFEQMKNHPLDMFSVKEISEEAKRQNSSEFSILFNRQQLADFLSVDRSAMSNELCKMRDEGLLEFERSALSCYKHELRTSNAHLLHFLQNIR